jgi:peptidoglycan/LPS O-acetylase OafA/YrhL
MPERLSYPAIQKNLLGHIPSLDALRGVAIIWVVWHNSLAGFETSGIFSKLLALFTNSGWVGVQLFFVLSGFLITGILVDGKKNSFILRNFYMRRLLRIFPLYYFILLVFFVLLPLIGIAPAGYEGSGFVELMYWTYTANWAVAFSLDGINGLSHLWSLAVEEQFYILWPFLVLSLSYRSLLITCFVFVFLALISRYAMVTIYPEEYEITNYIFTIARIDALSIGAILALFLRHPQYYKWLKKKVDIFFIITVLFILAILLVNLNFSPVAIGVGLLNQTLAAILFALGIYYLLQPASIPTKWLHDMTSKKWLIKVGKYSYAIYIVHMPVIKVLEDNYLISPNQYNGFHWLLILVYNFASVFTISFLLAVVSWYVIESPSLKLKKYFPMVR